MDVKGISWVGNLYQKFEAMCLEVEDIICQDTAKFVENQVETVGASVKKFYSDVMQDLLPSSVLDDEKMAVCNLAPDRYENVVICKKPVKSMKIACLKFDEEKSNENSKVMADTKRDINHMLPLELHHADDSYSVSSNFYAKEAHLNGDQRKECDENMRYKLDRDGRESTRNCEDSCDQGGKTATASLVKEIRYDLATESSNEPEIEEVATDSENDNLPCDVSSKFVRNNEETRLLSHDDLSAKLNGISSLDGSVTVIESSLNEDVQLNHPDEEISMFHLGRSDSWSLDENESENGAENNQLADEIKLDEACVMVNEDDFRFDDSQEEAKYRTYKKKMSRAFSFIKKSKRKQEYEELAAKYGHGFGKEGNLLPNLEVSEQRLQTEDVSEHDWQLL